MAIADHRMPDLVIQFADLATRGMQGVMALSIPQDLGEGQRQLYLSEMEEIYQQIFRHFESLSAMVHSDDMRRAQWSYTQFVHAIQVDALGFIRRMGSEEAPHLQTQLNQAQLDMNEAGIALNRIVNSQLSVKKEIQNAEKPEIPDEKPAPIRVKIQDNRLIIVESQTPVGRIDIVSADSLRAAIVNQLKESCDALDANTNIDPRFVRSLRNLSRTLLRPLADCSIEAIGFNAEISSKQLAYIKDELHEIDVILIEQILKSCFVLISQFDEWKNYLYEADKLDIKSIDSRAVISHVESLADELEAHKEVVDQEIVARFRDMTKPVSSGNISPDVVIPALMPSLSNLFGQISNYAFELSIQAPVTLTGDQKLAGVIIIAGLCKVIIEKYFPLFAIYRPLNFLIPVIDFAAKYFSPIARFFA